MEAGPTENGFLGRAEAIGWSELVGSEEQTGGKLDIFSGRDPTHFYYLPHLLVSSQTRVSACTSPGLSVPEVKKEDEYDTTRENKIISKYPRRLNIYINLF